ncbi:MerR family transcriptional regulator [Nocardioides sp. zg-1308]|uniref:MerR family transcriptional regulator n=1 Tax=Nocardioides sp. zg-1308 TaxID=2736253 RepID=UPI00155429A8|nr:MerR family transcriptional regulator [Nocardioides sp. zg-1308]
MTDDQMYSIGDLARRSGLPTRTVRFYSDAGVVPESARSHAGYRRYDQEAVARLDLVRTLRDLGLPLDTIRSVLAAQTSLSEVARTHVSLLDEQIRTLRLRRAVLRAVATTETTTPRAVLMHQLVTMSEFERQRLIDEFLDEAFGGVDANPELLELLRSMRPELPEDAEPAQVQAWVELAELVRDPDFRAAVRRMAEFQASERANGDQTGLHHDLTVRVVERVRANIALEIDPTSPAAAATVDELVGAYATTFQRTDTAGYRSEILHRLEIAADLRTQRYLHLLALINGWTPQPDLTLVFDWFTRALRVHDVPESTRTQARRGASDVPDRRRNGVAG